ncbi:acetyltransferase domain-containing protein [Xylariaceae sp. FL1651]|nr:acetyltransferase domain-containing protein [Xylariaceae sp. FL1651]
MTSDGPDAPSILVRTTLPCLPLPPISERPAIQTASLLIRPLKQSDLEVYHELRKQPEFMAETTLGKVDRDIEETQDALGFLIDPPNEHFNFGVFEAATGELIGDGGIHTIHSEPMGWPAIGYRFRKESWGRGYATEFMSAVLKAWWQLPRQDVELKIHPGTLKRKVTEPLLPPPLAPTDGGDAPILAQECVVADVASYNVGSQRVLEKLGCERFGTWVEEDTQLHRLGQPITISHYTLSGPS